MPSRQEVYPKLFLHTTRKDDPLEITYEVESARFKTFQITLDFSGSENMALDNGTLVSEVTLQPFERLKLGTLSRVDEFAGASWRHSWKLSWSDPPAEVIAAYVEKDAAVIEEMLEAARSLDFGSDAASCSELKQRCSDYGVHFVDIEFPPQKQSIAPDTAEASVLEARSKITWRRPKDFFPDGKYDVFLDKVEPNDIRQGQLADCWLLCALSALAERPQFVRRIFVLDGDSEQHSSPEGVYKLRICKTGQWREFRVDDYFPCSPCAGPVYSKGHGSELWVMLVEKAYAKIHRSYSSLRYGFTHEALMDLTGAPIGVYRFDGAMERELIKKDLFWGMLQSWDKRGCLMSCSTPGEDSWTESGGSPAGGPGLVKGHAYTLVGVKEAGGHRLLNIRNPWGSFEWNGDWSDDSELWTDALREEVGFSSGDDGLFWMSYDDFQKYFIRMNVCYLSTEAGAPWIEARRKGQFQRQEGEISSSIFSLKVEEPAEVWIGAHQHDTRIPGVPGYIDAGISVLRAGPAGSWVLVGSTGMEVDRQVQLQVALEPGEYKVVPRTTGAKMIIAEGASAEPARLYDPETKKFTEKCMVALMEIFDRFDSDMDGVLDRNEMNQVQLLTDGVDMGPEEYAFVVEYFDNKDGSLTPDGFIALMMYVFQNREFDEEELMRELQSMGYDNDLELASARTFVLSVHSPVPVSLEHAPWDAELYEEAMERPVIEKGTTTPFAEGAIEVHAQVSGFGGVTYALSNHTDYDGFFTMDFSDGAVNVMSHSGDLNREVEIKAGEAEIVHHLFIADSTKSWVYPGYKLKWRWD